MAISEVGDRAAQVTAAGGGGEVIDIAGRKRIAERQQLETVFRIEARLEIPHDGLRAFQTRRPVAVG